MCVLWSLTDAQDWPKNNVVAPAPVTSAPSSTTAPKRSLLKSVLGLQDVDQGEKGVLKVRLSFICFRVTKY
jgi:hypothetical protein